MVVLIATGTDMASDRLGSVSDLFDTDYGERLSAEVGGRDRDRAHAGPHAGSTPSRLRQEAIAYPDDKDLKEIRRKSAQAAFGLWPATWSQRLRSWSWPHGSRRVDRRDKVALMRRGMRALLLADRGADVRCCERPGGLPGRQREDRVHQHSHRASAINPTAPGKRRSKPVRNSASRSKAGRRTARGLRGKRGYFSPWRGLCCTHTPHMLLKFPAEEDPGRRSATTGPNPTRSPERMGRSPDGQKIVYAGLAVMNADGTNDTGLGGSGFAPAWSPDGGEHRVTRGPSLYSSLPFGACIS